MLLLTCVHSDVAGVSSPAVSVTAGVQALTPRTRLITAIPAMMSNYISFPSSCRIALVPVTRYGVRFT